LPINTELVVLQRLNNQILLPRATIVVSSVPIDSCPCDSLGAQSAFLCALTHSWRGLLSCKDVAQRASDHPRDGGAKSYEHILRRIGLSVCDGVYKHHRPHEHKDADGTTQPIENAAEPSSHVSLAFWNPVHALRRLLCFRSCAREDDRDRDQPWCEISFSLGDHPYTMAFQPSPAPQALPNARRASRPFSLLPLVELRVYRIA